LARVAGRSVAGYLRNTTSLDPNHWKDSAIEDALDKPLVACTTICHGAWIDNLAHSTYILSLQSFIQRCCGIKISAGDIRNLSVEALEKWLKEEYLILTAQANLDTINFLKEKIKRLEKAIIQRVKLNKGFRQLLTIPGIGNILAMTIMLEVGDIKRFPKVGNFASYCRCVPSKRLSDGKSKGYGNRKNGNRYLSWALTEAAQLGRRHNQQFRRYYNRKVAQANTSLATKALGNKLARICYYIMRDQVSFRPEFIAR
jgi:transposase